MTILRSEGSGETSTGFYSHTINQSLRLNRADSAHLYKTWGAAADSNQIFTFSIWVKRHGAGDGSNELVLLCSKNTGSGTGQGSTLFGFYRDSNILYYTENGGYNGRSKALFRDSGAWMHLCWQYDTTQSTESNRIRFYINGVQDVVNTDNWINAGHGLYPAENSVMSSMNQNGELNSIGAGINNSVNFGYFDGYIAEVIMLDGVTTDCTSFGEFKDGVWVPKEYSGSFGNNGYHLDFADSSAIGNDVSGNNNDWTSSSLHATDVVPDSPTNNFATFNPLVAASNTYSEGNLKNASGGAAWYIQIPTMFPAGISGKWYAEFYVHTCDASSTRVGIGVTDANVNPVDYIGNESPTVAYYDIADIYTGGSATATAGATFANGDIISVALDLDAGEVTFRKNNSTITNGTQNLVASTLYTFATTNYGSGAGVVANFGQDDTFAYNKTSGSAASADGNGIGDFYYAPPSGFLALCSSNLPAITIGPGQSSQSDDNFNTVLYTGDADNDVTATNTFASDFVWIKSRSASDNSYLQDIVRGFGASKSISANTSGGQGYNGGAPSSQNIVTTDSSLRVVSTDFATNSRTYVAWNWKAGGSASTIAVDSVSSGVPSIAASVSANATAGFSIVKYTGTGSAGTIGHGLSSAPDVVIVKNLDDNSKGWPVLHTSLSNEYLELNNTNDAFSGSTYFNNTAPTNSVFSVGTVGSTNESGDDFIAYCFHNVDGYSKFGSFSGNSAADGTFVYLGFRPAYVILKRDSDGVDWSYFDNKRLGFNVDNNNLRASAAAGPVEQTDDDIDFLSNGFKCRRNFANNQGTVLYFAWAEAPFKFANAR